MLYFHINKNELEKKSLTFISCISNPFLFDWDSFVISFGITDIRTPYGSWGGDITGRIYHLMEGFNVVPVVLL